MMPGAMTSTVVLTGLETALNKALALDADRRRKLNALAGKVVKVHCDSPPLIITVTLLKDQVRLGANDELQADAAVRGGASALLRLLICPENQSQRSGKPVIEGDPELLQNLQAILCRLDFDWEYHLSRVIGDLPTQALSDAMAALGSLASGARQSLLMNIDDYLHDEKKLLPSKLQVEDFCQSVDELRLRVDRLSQRLEGIPSPPKAS